MEKLFLSVIGYDPITVLIVSLFFIISVLIIIKIVIDNFGLENIYTFEDDLREIYKKNKIKMKKDEDSIYMGKSPDKKKIYLRSDSSHVYVCGTTGSGKTVTLSNFIKYGVDNNIPLLIIDGKGDTNENSLLDIVNKLKNDRKVYVIDFNNPNGSDRYNPFKDANYTVVKDMLINMSEWSEEHYKYNTERYLQRLIQLLCKSNIKLCFKSIVENMNSERFELLSASLLKSGVISKEEHINNLDLVKKSEKIIEGSVARFSTIIESELGQVFDEKGIDIYTAIKENAIILFILNPLIYPEVSTLIGRLITIDSKKAIGKLYSDKIERGLFIFDEINVYASKALLDLVNKSRSANITCVLASQSLSDLEESAGEFFREQVIENCNNYIIMRQNSAKNSESLANIIGTKETMNVTYQIESDNSITTDTGLGSARKTREYIYHPDLIKNLNRGSGFLISKDNNFKTKIIINKPF